MKEETTGFHSLNYIFCNDEYLLNINRDFLQHDDYTDIITFNLDHDGGIIGEIYISIERVKENALIFKVPFLKELYRVMFHGALHLAGYKDKSKAEQVEMREKEDYYLGKYLQ
jgi:rRNA maturation RNase YbeY